MIPSADWALQRTFVEDAIKAAWPSVTRVYLKAPESANIPLPYAVAKPTFASPDGATFAEDQISVSWEIFFIWAATDDDEVTNGVGYLNAIWNELSLASVPGGGMLPAVTVGDPVSMDADHDKRRATSLTFRYLYHLERP